MTEYAHFSRCLNVSRDGEEAMCKGKSIHTMHQQQERCDV